MERRPLAFRHLARLYELVSAASVCLVAEERDLLDSSLVGRAAAADRSIAEEVLALARERGWDLPELTPYAWKVMGSQSDLKPRLLRILARDVFELDGICRQTDDDDVASLASQLRAERRILIREVEQQQPQLTLPGAK